MLSIQEILILSILGGYFVQKIPSVKDFLKRKNTPEIKKFNASDIPINPNENLDEQLALIEEIKAFEEKRILKTKKTKSNHPKDKSESRFYLFDWPLLTIILSIYTITNRGFSTLSEYALAVFFSAIISYVFYAVVIIFSTILFDFIKLIFTEKHVLLSIAVLLLPAVPLVFFSNITWLLLISLIYYIILIGLWLKESAGWFGVIFTIIQIFVCLTLIV